MTTAGEGAWDGRDSDELDRVIVAERRRRIARGTKAERAARTTTRCGGRTRKGKACSLPTTPGSRYCALHIPFKEAG